MFLAAGAGVPKGMRIEEPYDSLSFAPTITALMGEGTAAHPGSVIKEMLP